MARPARPRLRVEQVLVRGVALEIRGDERALDGDPLALRPDVVEDAGRESAADPATLVGGIDLGMKEDDPPTDPPVLA